MRKLLSKLFPLILAGALLLSAVPAFALWSDAYGDQLTAIPTQLHVGTSLTTETYWSDYYNDRRTENYFVYSPNDDAQVLAYGGDTVTGTSTVLNAANSLAQEGYRVVAGINADFFDGNGTPTGILISGGELLSSDGGNNAVGFKADGSAIIDTPALALRGSLNGSGSAYITALNKARNSYGGIYAYTYDFNTKHTTGTTEAGVDVILEPATLEEVQEQLVLAALSAYATQLNVTVDDLTPSQWDEAIVGLTLPEEISSTPHIGGTAYYKVIEVVETAKGQATSVQPGQLVLSANLNAAEEELSYLQGMEAGDIFGLTITASNTEWNDVVEAVGGLYMLVRDGVAQSNFEATNAPRTAVGITADGDVIFYTVDGRKAGHSIGSSLGTLAQRLVELGCVSAICLDGGGSTTAVATTPDSTDPSLLNVPSDGSSRRVSSFLFLVADDTPTRDPDHVYLSAPSQHIMAGSSMVIEANLVDTNYIPMSGDVDLDASDGTIRGDVFTAPEEGGEVTITGSADGRRGTLVLNVVETPDELQIQYDNEKLTTLTLQPGESIDLTAVALYKHMTLATQDQDFTWSVEGNVGTVDEDGVFTASRTPGSGNLVLSKGDAQVTIPVSLTDLPLETLEDFEDSTAGSYAGFGVTTSYDTTTVLYGAASLRVDYAFSDASGAGVQLGLDVTDGYDQLTLSLYGDGSGNTLFLYDNNGNTTPVATLDFTGWKQVTVDLPSGCETLEALIISGSTTAGTIYLDQFVSTYDSLVDNTSPVVDGTLSGSTLSATAIDGVDGGLGADHVELTCDGQAVIFQVSEGTITADLSSVLSDGKSHLIALTAWDASGNRARKTWEVAATDGAASPFADNTYADGTPHWAASYLDRLYELGVLTGEEEDGVRYVRPDRNMTRMEFAVMMFRYLGLSEADYANVELPFADNAAIPDWAATAVKAMYSLGIMQGNQEAGGVYFSPSATITRAQAITMLGRLQEKGYPTDDLSAFSDSADVPSWALSYVQTMVAQGILTGSDGKLSPNDPMTRAQACKLLYMMQ